MNATMLFAAALSLGGAWNLDYRIEEEKGNGAA